MKVKVFKPLNESEKQEFEKEKENYKKLSKEEQIKLPKPSSRQQKEEISFLTENAHLGQLSEVGHLDDGRSYIGLPGIFSETLLKGVDIACQEQGLKVPLGISWITGANWCQCH